MSADVMKSAVGAYGFYAANGGGIPERGQWLIVTMGSEPINLIARADPPSEGTELADQLQLVIKRAGELEVGQGFAERAKKLSRAIDDVIPKLREMVVDEVDSIDDIVSELERAFLISIMISMTAHNVLLRKVTEWENAHQDFIQKRTQRDIGHYFNFCNFKFVEAPGPGIIHMQHLVSSIHSGANVWVAGGTMRTSNHYPEVQGVQYGQWFAYMHSLWDEQYRDRIAEFWSRGIPEGEEFASQDIVSDFFGDIRLIRNDFVHNKGDADESLKLRALGWRFESGRPMEIGENEMIELIRKFPREGLLEKPTRNKVEKKRKQERSSMGGSAKTALIERFEATLAERQFNKRKAIDEMLTDWLAKYEG